MQKRFFPLARGAFGALLVATALAASHGSARADLTPIFDGTTAGSGGFAGDTIFHYHVALSVGSSDLGGSGPNDFITLYDFAGFVSGSATVVSSTGVWGISQQFLGLTPANVSPPDSASLLNVSFTYLTATQIVGSGQTVLTFTLASTLASVSGVFTPYTGSSTNVSNGSVQGNVGFVQGPNPVPEPTTLVLMGIGGVLLFTPALRRRARVKV